MSGARSAGGAGARRAAVALVATLLTTACSDVPEWCAAEDAEVVLDPRPAQAGLSLQPAWRIDGMAEGRELVLPSSVAVDRRSGRVSLVDFDLGDIVVVTLDGDWIGRWGRRGEGPGEIAHAIAARWTERHTLEVYDPAGSKFVEFDTGGAVVGERRTEAPLAAAAGGAIAWISFAPDGTVLARPGGDLSLSNGLAQATVLRTDPVTGATDTVARANVPVLEPEGWMSFAVPDWPMPHAAVSAVGDVAVSGERPEYYIRIRRAGQRDLVLCRDVESRGSVHAAAGDQPPAILNALRTAPRPARVAAIGRITYDSDDRLWVQRDLPTLRAEDVAIGREGALFDVYAAAEYLFEVQFPERTRFLGAVDDLVIGLERGEMDELSIVAFRLVR